MPAGGFVRREVPLFRDSLPLFRDFPAIFRDFPAILRDFPAILRDFPAILRDHPAFFPIHEPGTVAGCRNEGDRQGTEEMPGLDEHPLQTVRREPQGVTHPMNRTLILASAVVATGGLSFLLAVPADSQLVEKAFVTLQPNPAAPLQSGHIGITGSLRSGSVEAQALRLGAGAAPGLVMTSDANGNASWQPLALTLPFSGSVNVAGCAFSVTNAGLGSAICGNNVSPTGTTHGVTGTATSPNGIGVYGQANTGVQGVSTTPNGNGVSGYASGGPDAWGVSGETGTGQAVIGRAGTGLPGGGFPGGTGVLGYSNTSNGYGMWAQTTAPGGVGLLATNTANTGAGFGLVSYTSSSAGTAIRANAVAPSGSTFGVFADVSSSAGTGVYGGANNANGNAVGVFGQCASPNGAGVLASNTSNTGNGVGLYSYSSSNAGTAIVGLSVAPSGQTAGVRGETQSVNGAGVFGSATASSGGTTGVFGLTQSPTGTGVLGANASTTGNNTGVTGYVSSPLGAAVYGKSWALTGPTTGVTGHSMSDSGYGVYGLAQAGSGTTYGVAGAASSPSGWALYAFGDFGASGLKSFRIDYPTDPENAYLVHYATESPYPQNFYSGNVTTGSDGYAWVDLPSYFDTVNANVKYQLTVVDEGDGDGFVQVKVSKKVVGNRFQIRSSAPRVEVSWRVEADRADRYTVRKRPTDVVEKIGAERGTYQNPELYGQPANRGLDAALRVGPAPLQAPAAGRTSRIR